MHNLVWIFVFGIGSVVQFLAVSVMIAGSR